MISFKGLQRGDTILEVMVCVSVIGLLLTAAFTLTNKNSTSQLQAQERTTASKIAETQFEMLKTYAGSNNLPDRNMFFCMVPDPDPNNNTGVKYIEFGSGVSPAASKDSDSKGFYPSECKYNTENKTEAQSGQPDGLYSVVIWSPGKSSLIGGKANIPYGLTVRWDAAGGGSIEELKTFYNLYDQASLAGGVGGNGLPQCGNSINDDGDAFTDFSGHDPDCTGPDDISEFPVQCSNGINDDGDAFTDFSGHDPGCFDENDDTESPNPLSTHVWEVDGNKALTPPGSCRTNIPYGTRGGGAPRGPDDLKCFGRKLKFKGKNYDTVYTYLNASYSYVTDDLPAGCYQLTVSYGNAERLDGNDDLAFYDIRANVGSNAVQFQMLTAPIYGGVTLGQTNGKKADYSYPGTLNLSGQTNLVLTWVNNKLAGGAESEGNLEIYHLKLKGVQCD